MRAEPIDYSRIQPEPLALEPLLLATERPDCGALAIFAGAVRNHHEGAAVSHLIYTAHAALCDKIIAAVEQETREQFQVPECRIVHRVGQLGIGDIAIYAVVRAPHRAEAFAALRYAVDSTKHRAPIWKEEFYPDGSSSFVTGCCIADGFEPPEHLKQLPLKANT
ncbi:MAG: molybdenum cofactor biosynthesis protein MoaE [Hydrocarboniphaga sp.]|uniref:molybdenum cofactor biosynthesis protein MoaE n=1 Tax=Hydrocarboniphaga sp. TaxID=2033016 RepID=UPI0026033C32|nr:molybdenum cofactor biosynthesis protein MoaE [Hydrocarboniphaga sp.]MDB5969772.1 molybdenum cofactor biosynthesis protein MoaE [Hydrocarboniphaga sp.]